MRYTYTIFLLALLVPIRVISKTKKHRINSPQLTAPTPIKKNDAPLEKIFQKANVNASTASKTSEQTGYSETEAPEPPVVSHAEQRKEVEGKGITLAGLNLENYDLQGALLSGRNFQGVILKHTNLAYACLERTNFENVPLHEVHMPGACVNNANFKKALINGGNLENLQACNSNFSEALFANQVNLSGAKFINANLTNTNFNDAVLIDADFTGAIIDGADFSHTIGANLNGAISKTKEMPKG